MCVCVCVCIYVNKQIHLIRHLLSLSGNVIQLHQLL